MQRFGDVHYFYAPPTASPPHHRFDKGSFIYLFENANERRARIEIANNPGSDDQDAFVGCKNKLLNSIAMGKGVSLVADGLSPFSR